MFALMPCLVRLHATEDGQGREIDHFQQHKWLMNVFSVGNFTHAGVRFGSQIQLHMEGAWVAKELGRGWVLLLRVVYRILHFFVVGCAVSVLRADSCCVVCAPLFPDSTLAGA